MNAAAVLRATGRRLGRGKRGFVALVLAFALVAGLAAAAVAIGRASAAATARLSTDVDVVVYLRPGLAWPRAEGLASSLRRLPGVRAVRPIDGRTALAHLRHELAAMGGDPSLLARVEDGFLPASLEIALAPGADLPARTADLVARVGRLEGIQAVDAMEEGVGQVAAGLALGRKMAWALAALAAISGLTVVLGLVLRERSRRREEVAALALVGATPLAIALPASLVSALGAGLGALGGAWAGAHGALLAFGGGWTTRASAALAGRELVWGALALAAVGLCAGWWSMPRPRLAELR